MRDSLIYTIFLASSISLSLNFNSWGKLLDHEIDELVLPMSSMVQMHLLPSYSDFNSSGKLFDQEIDEYVLPMSSMVQVHLLPSYSDVKL